MYGGRGRAEAVTLSPESDVAEIGQPRPDTGLDGRLSMRQGIK